ncbi:MAG: hypothetical protein EPN72_09760 [Nevskiaceae bacterium]|nr:MAG: hypothetical protein EPN63_09100 [Nevskiaceae bacterium]TBR72714.1 MAG: hypothetical protein EPN72_09760 [Nevskiaceae bacterium]
MNTPMVRDPNALAPSPDAHQQPDGFLARFMARAAERHWRLRAAGAPLCDTDLPDLHAVLVVPPQQVALEMTLRNERALKRYYAARVDYRERVLERNFDRVAIPVVDGIRGKPRMAEAPALRDRHVVGVRPLRAPRVSIGTPSATHASTAVTDDEPDPRPARTPRVS